jgi:hypothetical protein
MKDLVIAVTCSSGVPALAVVSATVGVEGNEKQQEGSMGSPDPVDLQFHSLASDVEHC